VATLERSLDAATMTLARIGGGVERRPGGRFLFAMWEGGGNVPPELGVARRLVARGHEVHVLGDPTIGPSATGAGCTFSPWRLAPHRTALDRAQDPIKDWETKNPLVMLSRARDQFIAGPAAAFAADTSAAIAAFRPNVVVADAFLFGSIIAAQAASLPIALLLPNIWMLPTPGTPAIGPGFALATTVLGRTRDAALLAVVNRVLSKGLPAINAARHENGLVPLDSFYDQALDADRILVLTSPAFDYAARSVPSNVGYVGPILDDPDWTEPWASPWPDTDTRPLVLVGFSSTYQNQGPVLRRVVEALSGLPVRGVLTVGQMLDPSEVAPSGNVVVVSSASHTQLLSTAALVVTHCGHGTVMKALAAGVPMVCIPMGRDQNDTAARLVHHGVGVRLSPRASASRIATAVQQVLDDDRYRVGAARLAAAIADGRGTSDVVAELEALFGQVPGR
jgi:MGT family glycosyltransferase